MPLTRSRCTDLYHSPGDRGLMECGVKGLRLVISCSGRESGSERMFQQMKWVLSSLESLYSPWEKYNIFLLLEDNYEFITVFNKNVIYCFKINKQKNVFVYFSISIKLYVTNKLHTYRTLKKLNVEFSRFSFDDNIAVAKEHVGLHAPDRTWSPPQMDICNHFILNRSSI